MNQPSVICFGEVLWDLLPSGKVAGGAPMNVAYHLNQLGTDAGMISRVGQDDLGDEILEFLKEKKVPTNLVQQDRDCPTGMVKVELTPGGHPDYEIVKNVAWDFIELNAAAVEAVGQASLFVYGSLAARSEKSRTSLFSFLDKAPKRVLDVNLRQPFFSKLLLEDLLKKADMAKMNDDELALISEWFGLTGPQKEQMATLKNHFKLESLIVTQGENGAMLLDSSGFYTHTGYRVESLVDTIGSGDAFLAGFLSKFLWKNKPADCLDFACRMGAFVATQRGGTPVLNIKNELFV